MTNQEILTKAIEKAIAGGWENEEDFKPMEVEGNTFLIKDYVPSQYVFDVAELIFNHDFAKALWGEARFKSGEVGVAYGMLTEPWQYHLQQMVIADDPIAYLGENI